VQAADARSDAGYEKIENSQKTALQRIFKNTGEFFPPRLSARSAGSERASPAYFKVDGTKRNDPQAARHVSTAPLDRRT
jgi:hypothetical protein